MFRIFFVIALLLVAAAPVSATFSIVAVDTVTKEVGSAGASCIAGSIIISDVHPGVGAIHTQSFWTNRNQTRAKRLMEAGELSPQEILDSIVRWEGTNSRLRQYGAVDFREGRPRSGAFTGEDCGDWKGHLVGPNYAIQGNILLGAYVLDSMEARFLRAEGSLADKLMAAMQGAKIVGADSRCLSRNSSTISAFIRVVRPDDEQSDMYLDLNVNNTASGVEPIDSLQVLFDRWKMTTSVRDGLRETGSRILAVPNPVDVNGTVTLRPEGSHQIIMQATLFDVMGRRILEYQAPQPDAAAFSLAGLGPGMYVCVVYTKDGGMYRNVLLVR